MHVGRLRLKRCPAGETVSDGRSRWLLRTSRPVVEPAALDGTGAAGSLVLCLGGRTRVEARSHLDWAAPAGLFFLRCRDLHLPLKFQTRRTRWLLLGQSTTMEP